MATATVLRTKSLDENDIEKSIAIVDVDGTEVEVKFWFTSISAYGIPDLKRILCAEALWQEGFQADARAIFADDASGEIVYDEATLYFDDQRNWQKRWLDAHKISTVERSFDPLA